MASSKRLSKNSIAVLSLIANGFSYAQIVDGHPDITYLDIFHAAEEALGLLESPADYQTRITRIKEAHPRAYEPWSTEEEDSLRSLYQQGVSQRDIAARLHRQPGAIASRMAKLGLVGRDDA